MQYVPRFVTVFLDPFVGRYAAAVDVRAGRVADSLPALAAFCKVWPDYPASDVHALATAVRLTIIAAKLYTLALAEIGNVEKGNAGDSCPAVACIVIHRFLSGATAPDFWRYVPENYSSSHTTVSIYAALWR